MRNLYRRHRCFAARGPAAGFGRTAPPPRGAPTQLWPTLIAALALISAGCGAPSASPAGPTPPAHAPPTPLARTSIQSQSQAQPQPRPDLGPLLASADIDGALVGPAKPGQDATLVIVFASWCGPCRRELALLGELRHQQPRARIIGLNAFEDWGKLSDQHKLRAFLAEHAPWLQVVHGDERVLQAMGSPRKIPSMYLFDHSGAPTELFLRTQRLPPDAAELRAAIERTLKRADRADRRGPRAARTTSTPTPAATR